MSQESKPQSTNNDIIYSKDTQQQRIKECTLKSTLLNVAAEEESLEQSFLLCGGVVAGMPWHHIQITEDCLWQLAFKDVSRSI